MPATTPVTTVELMRVRVARLTMATVALTVKKATSAPGSSSAVLTSPLSAAIVPLKLMNPSGCQASTSYMPTEPKHGLPKVVDITAQAVPTKNTPRLASNTLLVAAGKEFHVGLTADCIAGLPSVIAPVTISRL
jgi:hypothetical protein